MRKLPWRWILPAIQFVIAFAALVYEPYEMEGRYRVIGDDFLMLSYRSVWPPPTLRIAYAMNFPALATSYSIEFASWSHRVVVRYDADHFVLDVQACIFLAATFPLWYWVGSAVDRRHRPEFPASLRLVSLAVGFLFAMVVGGFASYFAMHSNADLPMREVGFVGLLWAVSLLWYFVSNLLSALRPA